MSKKILWPFLESNITETILFSSFTHHFRKILICPCTEVPRKHLFMARLPRWKGSIARIRSKPAIIGRTSTYGRVNISKVRRGIISSSEVPIFFTIGRRVGCPGDLHTRFVSPCAAKNCRYRIGLVFATRPGPRLPRLGYNFQISRKIREFNLDNDKIEKYFELVGLNLLKIYLIPGRS